MGYRRTAFGLIPPPDSGSSEFVRGNGLIVKKIHSSLHLALGDSAAGCLRAACRSHGLPGTALGIPEDLSHGPLDDGQARIDYMHACFRGYDDWHLDITDAFAPWRALIARIDEEKPHDVIIWSGDNVSEATFLAMACWWLRHRPEGIQRVAMPGMDGRCHVAVHTPAELANLFSSARELAAAERADLAEEFLRFRRETGLLRRWEGGRIMGVPIDRYDPLLLECCATRWTPAARVVGTAMSRCDGHNLLSDLFFCSRLQVLIDAGRIEADGSRDRLRDYAVRLADPEINRV